jgi:hypothetical protein
MDGLLDEAEDKSGLREGNTLAYVTKKSRS